MHSERHGALHAGMKTESPTNCLTRVIPLGCPNNDINGVRAATDFLKRGHALARLASQLSAGAELVRSRRREGERRRPRCARSSSPLGAVARGR